MAAVATPSKVRIRRQHVDVPGSRRQVFEFEERYEHGRRIAVDGFGIVRERITDQRRHRPPVFFADDRVAERESTLFPLRALAADVPGALPVRRELLPEVDGHAFARHIHEFGELRGVVKGRVAVRVRQLHHRAGSMPKKLSSVCSAIVELADALRSVERVCVLTGAGMSAESGVPTFRDAQTGLWAQYDPQELATPEAFAANPERVWDWYQYRRELVLRAAPNDGHRALAELAGLVSELTLVTQNVDGLHRRAGSPDVIEFHGNLFVDRCCRSGRAIDGVPPGPLAYCHDCGAPIRPGVVWFGEAIPEDALERAFAAAGNCEAFVSIGTAAEVYPAAGLIDRARGNGAVVAEINPQPTGTAAGGIEIAATAVEALLPLVNRLRAPRTLN